MVPITRKEQFYNAILEGTEAPTPVTREEQFLNAILTGSDAPAPITREELWLAKIAENGGGGGGGGSSDFSVASVTLVNAGDYPTNTSIAEIFNEEGTEGIDVYIATIPAGESETFSVPLYKGLYLLTDPNITTVSGDAEIIDPDNGLCFVTGDCTVNLEYQI